MTDEQRAILAAALADFPPTFGLRAFPGSTFRISASYSYFVDISATEPRLGVVVLRNGVWESFSKATPAELRAVITSL